MGTIKSVRMFLKERLYKDVDALVEGSAEWKQIRDLLGRTATTGESNSALFIGPRGVGKTAV